MNAPKRKSPKCCFCEKPGATLPGYCKKLKPRLAHFECTTDYEIRAASFGNWQPAIITVPAIDTNSLTKAGRDKLRSNLSLCACGHTAKIHQRDAQDNLLKCGAYQCQCDHFWYAVPQTRNTDLVVLQAVAISAEPTVLDKLRAITPERGATKDEVIAAQRKIIAMIGKEAA